MLRRTLLALALVPALACAQVDQPRPLVVMNLAAHPDDEDGNTLAYYRHHENAVAYSVIYTRGEGGQNEAGPELYERLGAIRTAETEAAARILGTQVFFLNFYDFGYSKSADETFAEWSRDRRGFWDTDDPIVGVEEGRDRVTARLVYLIRKLKPDVIFTNHDTTTVGPNTQHGHHQVVGITSYDAFALAADPTFHPEQLAEDGVDLWQPKRLFLRQWRNPDDPDVAVPVGDACSRNEACTDIAVRAAGQHFSQGFDRFAPRFRADTTYFRLLRQANGVAPVSAGANDLAQGLQPNPNAAEMVSGSYLSNGQTTRGTIHVNVHGTNPTVRYYSGPRGMQAVPGERVRLDAMREGTTEAIRTTIRLTGALDTTLVTNGDPPGVSIRLPANTPAAIPLYRTQYDHFRTTPPIYYQTDGKARPLPVFVVPPVIIDLDPAPIRLVPGENEIPINVSTFVPDAERVIVSLVARSMSSSSPAVFLENPIVLTPSDSNAVLTLGIPDDRQPGEYRIEITASVEPNGAQVPPYIVTRPATVLPDVHMMENLKIGFVHSYDDVTERALRAMGAEVTLLDSTALASADLSQFDTIVLDIRAYLVRADLREHNQHLLDWVRDGGHLVVGYHKTFEWNPGQSGGFFDMDVVEVPENGWAPYPLRLGRARVTREDAPVEVLQPDHIIFQSPHEIEPEDWNDWVQERGLYFPSVYDDRYTELLAMSDPGEDPLRGSLLLANYGDGTYLYSSLGWYRQLEALNPGAWRMFANLVSLPLTDGRQD